MAIDWSVWTPDSPPLEGDVIAADTETTIVDLRREIPQLVCLSASDGQRSVVVFPGNVLRFLCEHVGKARWVFHNVGFDWWVIQAHIRSFVPDYKVAMGVYPRFGSLWSGLVDQGRLGDTMLLEQMVRLAEGRDNVFYGLSLAKAAKEYLGREVTKEDDVRKGFTVEMADDWANPLYQRFWEYAAEDALVTYQLDEELRERAREAIAKLPFKSQQTWGLLTESIQVRAAISLAQVTRNGIGVDRPAVDDLTSRMRERADQAISLLTSTTPGLVQVWAKRARNGVPGSPKFTKNGLPQFNYSVLRTELDRVAEAEGLENVPETATGLTGISGEWWFENAPDHPFVKAWCELQEAAQALKFLNQLTGERVHSKYTTTVRTGRTSASDPPIQQVPRGGDFRKLFIAPEGKVLVAADYSFIELVTLAAVCEERLGYSKLGEVLRQGVDPHAHTARLVLGLSLGAWEAMSKEDRKAARQKAKPLNFGIPGGLGAKKLRAYAKLNYGVDFSAEEAKVLRQRVITEVYPEWSDWLEDGLAVRLSQSLGCPVREARLAFGADSAFLDPVDHPAARVLAGEKNTVEGIPFASYFVESVWQSLEHCIGEGDGRHGPWIADRIYSRAAGRDLADYLVSIPSVTLTGRSRLRTHYGDYRNTSFQGLAADGAKLALWELTKKAYKVVAFIHDEILTEVEEGDVEYERGRIATVMSESFSRAIGGDIPVRVETAYGRFWQKP